MVEIKLEYSGNMIKKDYLNFLNYLENENSGFEFKNLDNLSKYKFNDKLETEENKNNSGLEVIVGGLQDKIIIKTSNNKPISMKIPAYQKCIQNNYKLESKY